MRQGHGKNSLPWWKEQTIFNWANDSWRFRMEKSFEEAICNIERASHISLFLQNKERLTSLNPNMSERMVHRRILRKCGGELGNSIIRCIKYFSTEDYINSMEYNTTRARIGRNLHKPPIEDKESGKPISGPNKPQDRACLKFNKCGSTSHLTNTCPNKTRINEIEIENTEDRKETKDVSVHESKSGFFRKPNSS
ncbi:hypothetical protein O181_079816 [Austropuccinia psidii MF-1]|uniref:Uncharacterized protein n=1 Tax=Austropuccinia psidii MF-1 TaxID=1389203 RepID=A0A9Q3IEC2_9BASI|nr:hypothetical protein [Austropuccinia psidii MF-1]